MLLLAGLPILSALITTVSGQASAVTWEKYSDHWFGGGNSYIAVYPAPGGDDYDVNAISVEECKQRCLEMHDCRVIVYDHTSRHQRLCQLHLWSVEGSRSTTAVQFGRRSGYDVYEPSGPCNLEDSEGSGSDDEDTCMLECGPGEEVHVSGGWCVPCPYGYYKEGSGVERCTLCPDAASTTLHRGSSSLEQCISGPLTPHFTDKSVGGIKFGTLTWMGILNRYAYQTPTHAACRQLCADTEGCRVTFSVQESNGASCYLNSASMKELRDNDLLYEPSVWDKRKDRELSEILAEPTSTA